MNSQNLISLNQQVNALILHVNNPSSSPMEYCNFPVNQRSWRMRGFYRDRILSLAVSWCRGACEAGIWVLGDGMQTCEQCQSFLRNVVSKRQQSSQKGSPTLRVPLGTASNT